MYNSVHTTMNVVLKEFEKAHNVMKGIRERRYQWDRLFRKLDFFRAYSLFLRIDALTKDTDSQKYLGFI